MFGRNSAKQRKFEQQLNGMRAAGLVVWEAHDMAARMVKPGVSTRDIDRAVDDHIVSRGGTPLFKGVPGEPPFPAATCISVNQAVVHGIPGDYCLCAGDVVSVDIGVKLNGWCGDAAVTHPVGSIDPMVQKLLDTTEGVLAVAIDLIPRRRRWSQVAWEMEKYVHAAGFSVVEGLVGHGIGRTMWESPQVPNYYTKEFEKSGDFRLEPGVVIAVEPMINMGVKETVLLADNWTIVTEDGKPSAHFEHTIAITEDGPFILTAGPDGRGWAIAQVD